VMHEEASQRTSEPTFADNFWGADDSGIEVIAEKLRSSKQTCDELRRIYDMRAQIEEDYGERLLKLSQQALGSVEQGTFSDSLSQIPIAMEATARAHMDLSQKLKSHLEMPLSGFVKDQKETRKSNLSQIEKSRQLKELHMTNVAKAKEIYEDECKKYVDMQRTLNESRPQMSPEEVEKSKQQIKKVHELMTMAEQDYKRAASVLSSISDKWIEDHKTTCNVFQSLEEDRLNYLRSSLFAYANLLSSVFIIDDQASEKIRSALESTDVDRDISLFIGNKGTGNNVPEKMKFQSYFDTNPEASAVIHNAEKLDVQFKREEEERQKAEADAAAQRQMKEDEEAKNASNRHTIELAAAATAATAAGAVIISQSDDKSSLKSINGSSQHRDDLPIQDHELKSHHDAIATALHQVETMLDDVNLPPHESDAPLDDRVVSPLSTQSVTFSPGAWDDNMRRAPIADSFANRRTSEWLSDPVNQKNMQHGDPQHLTSPERYKPTDNKRSSFLPVANPQYLQANDRLSDHSASRSSVEQASETNGSFIANGGEPKQNESQMQRSINTNNEDEDSDDNQEPINVPRPPPKDEKWVISSIRRPQQVPVRVQNARMYENVTSPGSEQTSFDQSFSTSAYSEHPDTRRPSLSQANDLRELPPVALEGGDLLENGYKPDDESDVARNRNSRGGPNLKIAIPGQQKRESVNNAPPPQDVAVNHGFMDNVRNQLQHTTSGSESMSATRDKMMRMFDHGNNIPPGQQQYPGQGPYSQPQSHDMNNSQQGRMEGQTMGIRAPPWQQSDRQNGHRPGSPEQPMSQYLTNYPQENEFQENENMQSNLGRMNSVSGPRLPNQNLSKGSPLPPSELLSMKLTSPGQTHERHDGPGRENGNGRGNMYQPNNGYAYNDSPDPSNAKPGKKAGAMDFANKMKIALKNPSDPRWPENGSPAADKANQRSSLPAEKGPSHKEGKSGRFSLAIFGKKDKDSKKNKEEREYPISGPGANSLGRASGNQIALASPRHESLSYPVTANSQTFSSMPNMNPTSWQQESHRGQYNEANEPSRSSQPAQQSLQQTPQSPGANQQMESLEDGTPVLEYARALWSYSAKIPTEMSFQAGDVMAVINKQDDGWWEAQSMSNRSQQRALIPGNFFQAVS